ncbi:EAL domain, c-di-GMP-specific phosphodiesterase class I (or its enzymatically inactive variant) [Terriglobus roseus]|uniref:EAL domain, c-di-GMP-specific phosphodiesterase class I (Or its enzymatically inactive variant) n=2 Tax=Terriglobus roseus TaxID=392734 RepID=A0A1G7L8C3_9BACT|nr:EAL domain, c-di-GMP-specific phosphodiesterase class I (or its enzymatically inactive variant) [Terriglobus roseus]
MELAFPASAEELRMSFPFSMAFQPMVNVTTGDIYAYEALVRGPQGQSAASILGRLKESEQFLFHQNCRNYAMRLATNLGITKSNAALSINFLPRAIRTPEACCAMTLTAAKSLNFPYERMIFEMTDAGRLLNTEQVRTVAREYQRNGFRIALSIDDLQSALSEKAICRQIRADILKLNMAITRNLHLHPHSQAAIASLQSICHAEEMDLIAEGVESPEEYVALLQCGIEHMQGYLFAMPGFESLPNFTLPTPVEMDA